MEQYFFGIIPYLYRETLDVNEKWAMTPKLGSFIECSEWTWDMCHLSAIFRQFFIVSLHCFTKRTYFHFLAFFSWPFFWFISFENNEMLSFLFECRFFFFVDTISLRGNSFVCCCIHSMLGSHLSSVILVSNELDDRALFISLHIFRDSVEHSSEHWQCVLWFFFN